MRQLPNIAFGQGFKTSRIKAHSAPVYNVDVSTGMPIVKNKKHQIINNCRINKR